MSWSIFIFSIASIVVLSLLFRVKQRITKNRELVREWTRCEELIQTGSEAQMERHNRIAQNYRIVKNCRLVPNNRGRKDIEVLYRIVPKTQSE